MKVCCVNVAVSVRLVVTLVTVSGLPPVLAKPVPFQPVNTYPGAGTAVTAVAEPPLVTVWVVLPVRVPPVPARKVTV